MGMLCRFQRWNVEHMLNTASFCNNSDCRTKNEDCGLSIFFLKLGWFGFIRSIKSHFHCSFRIHGFFSSQVCDEWCPFRPGSFFKSHHQESQFNTAQSWQEVQLQEESGWGRFQKVIACQDELTKTLYNPWKWTAFEHLKNHPNLKSGKSSEPRWLWLQNMNFPWHYTILEIPRGKNSSPISGGNWDHFFWGKNTWWRFVHQRTTLAAVFFS